MVWVQCLPDETSLPSGCWQPVLAQVMLAAMLCKLASPLPLHSTPSSSAALPLLLLQVRFSTKSFGVEAATVAAEALRAVAGSLQHADMSDIIAGRPVSASSTCTAQQLAAWEPFVAHISSCRRLRPSALPARQAGAALLLMLMCSQHLMFCARTRRCGQSTPCPRVADHSCVHVPHCFRNLHTHRCRPCCCPCRRMRRLRRCGWWLLHWPRRSCGTSTSATTRSGRRACARQRQRCSR